MKIILLKDIPKVGRKYDIKNVADGYALNMLIPRGLAQIATPQAEKNIESMKAKDMVEKKVQGELLLKSLDVIKTLVINIKEKANDKGHLFAGITKERLVEEIIKTARLNIDLQFNQDLYESQQLEDYVNATPALFPLLFSFKVSLYSLILAFMSSA